MSISGHANEQSVSSYNSRPSVKQLKNCSNILSNVLVSKEASSAVVHVPVTPASSSISYSASNSSALAFPNGFFHGCAVPYVNMYVLPQSHYNSAWIFATLALSLCHDRGHALKKILFDVDIVDESTDHAKPHFDLFFTTISASKKMYFSERELKKALRDTWRVQRCLDSYRQRQISQSDCEISSNCGKNHIRLSCELAL